jgi:N-formylglutamate deformylase
MHPRYVNNPEDTDWFVHELYDFAPELGITMIRARFTRYAIDLNRDPARQPLYADGRKETALVPETSFAGEPLYKGRVPDVKEVERRLAVYYQPYHEKLRSVLGELRSEFGTVVLYDAHSIRRFVPTIRPHPFPDLILGDGNGKTAHPRILEAAWRALKQGPFQVSLNDPFQGGYITRHYGNPEAGAHALQLEMSQDIYLDDQNRQVPHKVDRLKKVLRGTLESLLVALEDFP